VIRARGQIRIDRPPEAVFDFLADLSNEPKFNPDARDIVKVTDGEIGLGSVYTETVMEPQGAFRLATPLLIPLMRWTMQKQRAPKIKQAVERA